MIRVSAASDATPCTKLPRVSSPLRIPADDRTVAHATSAAADPFLPARAWLAARGMTAFGFQEDVWRAHAAGRSGLVHAPTGMGKTLAAAVPPLVLGPHGAAGEPPPLTLLWLTPLRALAADTGLALAEAAAALRPHWTVAVRTGDTAAPARAQQTKRLPTALVTTPESLTLFLARADWRERFAHLDAVVVDEWHELLSTKRGVQTELALARLAALRPDVRIWGLSATLANLDVALAALVGPARSAAAALVRGHDAKAIVIDSMLPKTIERFPWAGHIGLKLLPGVIRAIERARSTLVFTNVRSQTEIWYQALLEARPDWAGQIALHHGSLERDVRDWVEDGLRRGRLRAVVCTSSLDLGVDFAPVDQVLQIGSPKGVARLLQRAGRSGHQPGATSRVTVVPAQALELVEAAAAREAARQAPDRVARPAAARTGRARPAPRHLRARRRLPARGAARGSSRHARVSRPLRRRVAVRARLRRPWRRRAQRVSGVPARRDRRGRHRARARRGDRAPASDRHRHDRVRGEHHRAPAQRPGARSRRGRLHRATRPRRLRSCSRAACSSSCACAS